MAALSEAYAQGFTILVNRIHRRSQPIAELCQNLEAALHHHVGANLYLTPAGSQGFQVHYDDHDVFVLQLDGRKEWRIYEPREPLPLRTSRDRLDPDELGLPSQTPVLNDGDLLYIPRGWPHEALTSELPSLHLTVGIHSAKWVDLVQEAILQMADRDVRWRRSLPPGWLSSPGPLAAAASEFRDFLREVETAIDLDAAKFGLGVKLLREAQLAPDSQFVALNALENIELGAWIAHRAGIVSVVTRDDDEATIHFPGNSVSGPAAIGSVLDYIAQTPRFRVKHLPGILTDNGKLVLIRRLVREGLLRLDDSKQEEETCDGSENFS
jgi:hypothetical protein